MGGCAGISGPRGAAGGRRAGDGADIRVPKQKLKGGEKNRKQLFYRFFNRTVWNANVF